jgi:hypothetical protein
MRSAFAACEDNKLSGWIVPPSTWYSVREQMRNKDRPILMALPLIMGPIRICLHQVVSFNEKQDARWHTEMTSKIQRVTGAFSLYDRINEETFGLETDALPLVDAMHDLLVDIRADLEYADTLFDAWEAFTLERQRCPRQRTADLVVYGLQLVLEHGLFMQFTSMHGYVCAKRQGVLSTGLAIKREELAKREVEELVTSDEYDTTVVWVERRMLHVQGGTVKAYTRAYLSLFGLEGRAWNEQAVPETLAMDKARLASFHGECTAIVEEQVVRMVLASADEEGWSSRVWEALQEEKTKRDVSLRRLLLGEGGGAPWTSTWLLPRHRKHADVLMQPPGLLVQLLWRKETLVSVTGLRVMRRLEEQMPKALDPSSPAYKLVSKRLYDLLAFYVMRNLPKTQRSLNLHTLSVLEEMNHGAAARLERRVLGTNTELQARLRALVQNVTRVAYVDYAVHGAFYANLISRHELH